MPPLRHLRLPRAAALLTPLLLALLIVPLASGVADASASYQSNCGVNLRTRPSTGATIKKVIPTDTTVYAVERVGGSSWSASCGSSVKGTAWYKITAINGRSVSSMLGVSAVYAATGLFRSGTAASEGVDVSSWQGAINWGMVRKAGKTFAIAKATEGNTWTDPRYAANRNGALSVGIKFTGYHFARPGTNRDDAISEADHFVSVLKLSHGMLVPALDLEVSGGLSVSTLQAWTKQFVGRVYARTGAKPMIYTSASFWSTYMGNTTWFAANGYKVLWVARWNVSSPSVPATNWGGASWTFWQYSDCGSVAGISGCTDLDRFKGTDFRGVTF